MNRHHDEHIEVGGAACAVHDWGGRRFDFALEPFAWADYVCESCNEMRGEGGGTDLNRPTSHDLNIPWGGSIHHSNLLDYSFYYINR